MPIYGKGCGVMMQNIKMIALDLDGTLLHSDKTISDYAKDIIQKCRIQGIKVIFATVRGTTQHIAPAELFDGCVKKSGAVAYVGDALVYEKVMPIDMVRGLLLACHDAGLKVAMNNGKDDTHYANFNVAETWADITDFKMVDFAHINFDTDKIYAITETPNAIDVIKNNLPEGVYMFPSRDNLTFISHEGAVKSKAIMALGEQWGIKKEEILSFGDDLIDIEMLQYCGVGVAMGNALDAVKAAADAVCDTNDNDGVAKWIEAHVLQKREAHHGI